MSVHATTWVWEQKRWTGNVLLVALAVADAANREGNGSCQSAGTIASMIGADRSTVFRALKRLEEDGAIVRDGYHPKYKTVIWSMPIGLGLTPADEPEGGSQNATGGGVAKCDGGGTSATGGVAPVQHNPKEITPSTSSSDSSEVKTTRATGAHAAVAPETHPSRPIPHDWQPRPVYARWLMRNYPGIDLRESARRFVAHHVSRQDTSRSWEASLSVWVSQDWQRWSEQQGTDDLGVPKGQRRRTTAAPQPGDPGYVDPEELLTLARGGSSVTEPEEQS